jgi:hypothetical protein
VQSDEKIVDVIKKEIQQVGKPDKLRFVSGAGF